MEFTLEGRVIGHALRKDNGICSIIEIRDMRFTSLVMMSLVVAIQFPLASVVYISVSDKEPEGGAA